MGNQLRDVRKVGYIGQMKRFYERVPWSLPALIVLTGVLFSLHLWVGWSPTSGTSTSRLLDRPILPIMEVGFSTLLIFGAMVSRSKPNWAVVIGAFAAIGCGLYHLFTYFIGIEFFLLHGASELIRRNFRKEAAGEHV